MDTLTYIEQLINKARAAQKRFESEDQRTVDMAVQALARAVFENAEMLAENAVRETGMGNVSDKITKHKNKPRIVWNSLRGKKSRGILARDEETGITTLAKPIGVIGAVTPVTNPIVTPMSNAMFALKCGNAIIIAPHPHAKNCGSEIVSIMRGKLASLGLPEDLIQVIAEPTSEITNFLIRAVDLVIATGGMAMVKAVYSSGKPALGVGAGNVQTILDRGIDYAEAIPKIVAGRAFDNGILCTADQSVICPKEDYEAILECFEANDAFVVRDADTVSAFRNTLFPEGVMNRHAAGQSAQRVAAMAGISIPETARIIVLEAAGFGADDLLAKEKMCPCLCIYPYQSFETAVDIAAANLEKEGKGHTVSLHSNDIAHIEYAAERLEASRFVVNQVCAIAAAGSFQNGLAPSNTLGCGSWGNNSISENLDYKHLMNVSRIAHFMKDAPVPTDEELWAPL